jgi:dethiobiotin synthetase
MSTSTIVITGTDTDVGKTVFAAGLVAAIDGCYWKPVQSGLDGPTDTETVRALSGLPADRFVPEAYRLQAPLAPFHAAMAEGITIDVARLMPPITPRPLVIEGAGGLLVPVTATTTMADLFQTWNAPVVIVARTALGTINHTLLTIEALRARAIPIAGVAFMGPPNQRSEAFIAVRGQVPWLGRMPRLAQLDPTTLREAASASFDFARIPGLETIVPAKPAGWHLI